MISDVRSLKLYKSIYLFSEQLLASRILPCAHNVASRHVHSNRSKSRNVGPWTVVVLFSYWIGQSLRLEAIDPSFSTFLPCVVAAAIIPVLLQHSI